MTRVIPALVVLAAAAVAVTCWLHFRTPAPSGPAATATPAYDVARSDAARLPVAPWDGRSDFRRSAFGEPWSDDVTVEFGHNGCNTRDDVLRRDLADLVVRPGTCFAQSGTLHDPYGGGVIAFNRGPTTSDRVQVDHVVSLSDAWYSGARKWTDERRRTFANDPGNLLAVDGKANFDKAFRNAGSWLPPNVAYRCAFVAKQVEVKSRYGLTVSAKEKRAISDVLAGC